MKRTLIILMTAVLVVGFGFAAGGQEATGEEAEVANFNPTGFPIVDEKITLKVVVRKHGLNGDFETMPPVIELEELTNIHLDMEVVSPAGWVEKKNLLLASGDLPDFFTGGGITQADQVRYGPQGFFIPLEGLIEKYGVETKRIFALRPQYKMGITAPDGHIYVLPWVHELAYRENPENFFVNTNWLDKLGLEIPTTTEEYYQMLKAFKKEDPNGNGQADEIPLSFLSDYGDHDIRSLFGSWGVIDRGNHIMVKDGKVLFTPVQQGYKEGILYFRKLFAEGLIDPEAFTQSVQEFRAKGKNETNLFGSFLGWLDANEVGRERADNEFMAIPPLKGPGGEEPIWLRAEGFLDEGHFVITSANKYPEATLRWGDACLEDERSFVLARGAFGVNLQKNEDGSIEFIPTPEGMSYGEFRFKNTPGDAFPWVVLRHWYDKVELAHSQDKKNRVHYPIYQPYLEKEIYPDVYYLPEQEEELATLTTDINTYVEKKRAQWIVGDADPVAEWDSYLAQLDKMGLDKLMGIYQAAYDSYLSAGN